MRLVWHSLHCNFIASFHVSTRVFIQLLYLVGIKMKNFIVASKISGLILLWQGWNLLPHSEIFVRLVYNTSSLQLHHNLSCYYYKLGEPRKIWCILDKPIQNLSKTPVNINPRNLGRLMFSNLWLNEGTIITDTSLHWHVQQIFFKVAVDSEIEQIIIPLQPLKLAPPKK